MFGWKIQMRFKYSSFFSYLLIFAVIYLWFFRYEPSNVAIQPNNSDTIQRSKSVDSVSKIAILMLGCNRTAYMIKSLKSLIQIRRTTQIRFKNRYKVAKQFEREWLHLPVIVSLDCHFGETLDAVDAFKRREINSIHRVYDFVENHEYARQFSRTVPKHLVPYYRLSNHYRYALNRVFEEYSGLEQLIIVEDDLEYSQDFLEYFLALSPILARDRTLFCVSAWNDNGKKTLMRPELDSGTLERTDFFPGLGWMLNRDLWTKELRSVWPDAYWDDWLRGRMFDRECIHPIVSRTSTFGQEGVSNGQFFVSHLSRIKVSKVYVPFYQKRHSLARQLNADDFRYNLFKKVYDKSVEIDAYRYHRISSQIATVANSTTSYRITYYTNADFTRYTKFFGLMNDLKVGVPRSAYDGIIGFSISGHRAYLAPPISRKIYLKNWS